MNLGRVFTLSQRVMRQVLRDHRTVALLVFAPLLVLTLGAILFRAEPPAISLGVVNEDRGVQHPVVGTIALGERMRDELDRSGAFILIPLSREEVDDRLRESAVQGVVVIPPDFSAKTLASRRVVLYLRLEGSNPTRSQAITAQVTRAAMVTLATLTLTGGSAKNSAQTGEDDTGLPVSVQTTYLFGGAEFDTLDFVAPVYVAFLAMFFVFLLACVAFLRERSQGTMERLAATPATRTEIVLGYMIGLGLFALVQVTVILFYTVWVLNVHYRGSLGLLLLVITLLAVVGVNLGILASAFARTEFQVIQFIPLVIIPQVLLGGTFWAVADMPAYLQPVAHLMPIYYANQALRDVMLKGWGLAEIWPNLAVLIGIAGALFILSAWMIRREVT